MFLAEFYIILPSIFFFPKSTYYNFSVDSWLQTHTDVIRMIHLREQNMTSALNIIAVKYMHWFSGKILRTLMVSSVYIQLNTHHFSKYFLLWDSKGTANCHFRTTFALQSWTSETLSGLMYIPLLIKRIKTYSKCGSPYVYCIFTTAWQALIKFYVNIYHWNLAKVLLWLLRCSSSYSNHNTMVTILICDHLTQAQIKTWLSTRDSVLVVKSLMSRSQLLSNSWLYFMCCINCSVLNAYQLTNACLSGFEPLILCDGVAARGWPVNDWQWHDWVKYSYALYVSVFVCVCVCVQPVSSADSSVLWEHRTGLLTVLFRTLRKHPTSIMNGPF